MNTGGYYMTTKLKEGLVMRSPEKTESKKAQILFDIYNMHVSGEKRAKAERIAKLWESPNFSLKEDARVIVDENDDWLGYIAVWNTKNPYILNGIVFKILPDYLGTDVETLLDEWGEQKSISNIPKAPKDAEVHISQSVFDSQKKRIQSLKNKGFSEERFTWRMGIDLDDSINEIDFPEGITVSTFSEKKNLLDIINCERAAFKDHWGYVESPIDEEIKKREHWIKSYPFHDPTFWFIAYSGDEIVGLSLCDKESAQGKNTAYIGSLCVKKEFRKKGIAAALLRHSFSELKKAGRTKANLHVDAASLTGATKLYEGVGMKVNQFRTEMEKVIREGKSYRTENL